MANEDYYQTLGVPKNANADAISKSFRKLAKKYHPDRNPGDQAAEKKFKAISAAHEVLGDAKKRKKYDQLRDAQARGGFSGGDFSEFFRQEGGGGGQAGGGGDFADLFSGLFGGGRQSGRVAPQRGEDILQKIDVPFDKAIQGGSMTVRVPRVEPCSACGGSGARKGSKLKTCPACHGTGGLQEAQGAFSFSRTCPACMGKGKIPDHPCPGCHGSGKMRQTHTRTFRVREGVRDGTKIRLPGDGEPGAGGGPPGDLYLQVHVLPHPDFERQGYDIYSDVDLNIVQAAFGTRVSVKTVAGAVELRIPAGTSSGAKLRLKDRGIAHSDGSRGCHYVRVRIVAPRDLSPEQAEKLRAFAQSADLAT
ncbi:J domain-containing protein [bacterium]|nr:J domain-containing protein [bacterium]